MVYAFLQQTYVNRNQTYSYSSSYMSQGSLFWSFLLHLAFISQSNTNEGVKL